VEMVEAEAVGGRGGGRVQRRPSAKEKRQRGEIGRGGALAITEKA